MSEEVKKWLKKAEKDLLAAKINLQQELYDVSSFLSHQAAEKALKALYILKFKRLWKTHDLVGLLVKLNSEEDLLEICDELNRHYIDTRYPSEAEYTETVAEDAIKNSKKVVEWVKKKLEKN
ncbi:MAG: HEPN domain-containing protein [Candidatus Aenigmarchaeota archaeon]|nr:HEPN domain-containing protein [Candidatus Aenigmarchaeota archaeon]